MTDNRKGYEPGKDKPRKGYGKGEGPGRKTYGQGKDPAPEEYGEDEGPTPTGYGESEEPPAEEYGEKEPEPYGEEDEPGSEEYGEEGPTSEGYGDGEEGEPTPEDYGGDEKPAPRGYDKTPPGGGYDESCEDPGDGEPCTPQDPLCHNDPKPADRLRKVKVAKAQAETAKALEPILEAIALEDPAFIKKQKETEKAYAAATGNDDSPDNLRKRYADADAAFKEAMSYLRAKRPGLHKTLLQEWVQCNLCNEGAPVRKVLNERRQVTLRLRNRKGPRERALQDAHEATERWAAAWTAWADPVKNIAATLKSYENRIGTLKDLFNDEPTADKAIFEFLFEVAPLHLGLRAVAVGDDEPGIKLVRALLSDFPDVQAWLFNAKQRGEGGLYLTKNLPGEREEVLQAWETAANAEAEAKADYDMRPDDAAKLGERYAGLKDDKWLARVKTALEASAAA